MCDNRQFRGRAQNTCNGWLRGQCLARNGDFKIDQPKTSLTGHVDSHTCTLVAEKQPNLTCNNILDSAKSSPVNCRLCVFV